LSRDAPGRVRPLIGSSPTPDITASAYCLNKPRVGGSWAISTISARSWPPSPGGGVHNCNRQHSTPFPFNPSLRLSGLPYGRVTRGGRSGPSIHLASGLHAAGIAGPAREGLLPLDRGRAADRLACKSSTDRRPRFYGPGAERVAGRRRVPGLYPLTASEFPFGLARSEAMDVRTRVAAIGLGGRVPEIGPRMEGVTGVILPDLGIRWPGYMPTVLALTGGRFPVACRSLFR